MNQKDPSNVASSTRSSTRKRKAAAEIEDSLATKRDKFYATYRQQNFPFPDSIMYFITMNPATPNGYLKATQSCKHFFVKNPILVYFPVVRVGKEWRYDVPNWCENPVVKLKSKIWITDKFNISSVDVKNQNFLSSLIPKLYRFDVKELYIIGQTITLNEYIYLSATAEYINLKDVTVKDENDGIVALEKLVDFASKAIGFSCYSNTVLTNITSRTAKELIGNPNFSRFESFFLGNIPETFDIEAFYGYIKTNIFTRFHLYFCDPISDAYKNQLEAITDEMLTSNGQNYKCPFIYFPGIGDEKLSYEPNITRRKIIEATHIRTQQPTLNSKLELAEMLSLLMPN